MQSLTSEQRIRVNNCRAFIQQEITRGTERHCIKLFAAGMISEAIEILASQKQITANQAHCYLINNQK